MTFDVPLPAVIGGAGAFLATALKLIQAWTRKAIAEAEHARQVRELRDSHAKFMARFNALEQRLNDDAVRADERVRVLTNPMGVKRG